MRRNIVFEWNNTTQLPVPHPKWIEGPREKQHMTAHSPYRHIAAYPAHLDEKIIEWCVYVCTTPAGAAYINWGGPGQTQMGLLVAGLPPNFIKSIWCITTEAQPLALPLQTTRVVEMRDLHRLAYYIRERDTRNIYRAETTMSKQRCLFRAAAAAFVHPSFDRDRPVTRNTFRRIIYIYALV
jgi:hypothetical protein